MEQILDPRGCGNQTRLTLAKRAGLEALRRGPVLFYDNTKLAYCNYGEIFPRIKEHLTRDGITNFIDHRETVRGKSPDDLKALAAHLAKQKPVAAVMAFADMGVAPASTLLTIALEENGIPTVLITAPPGADLARATAHYRAGHLCLRPVDISQGSTAKEARDAIDHATPAILEALSLDGKQTALDFPIDRVPPAENGLLAFTDLDAMNDQFEDLYLGDGLPVVPPTPVRFERMLAFCPHDPKEVLAREAGPSGRDITVADLAVAAVMAGCKPAYMPIIVAAFRAMTDHRYNFLQSISTAYPGGNLVLVSGPLAQALGIHGGPGCLGPGFRANATIGRAINLTLLNVCRAIPGHSDLAGLSSQAEFTYCFAEDPDTTPWQTINAERYAAETTSVYVLKAEVPHDITDLLSRDAGHLLETLVGCCTTLGSNNVCLPGSLVLVLSPDHARILADQGWSKDDIRRHVHETAHHPAARIQGRGIVPVRPSDFEGRDPMPVTRSPSDVEIVVAGARGGHSAVILPWGLHSEAVTAPVLLPDGTVPATIEDFRA
jgi:hypothetical protein